MAIMLICFGIFLFFLLIGIIAIKSKKPIGIYSNIKAPQADSITDVKAYNHACGMLFVGYGAMIGITGVSSFFLSEKTLGILLAFIAFFGAIGMMIIYECVIAEKYIKKDNNK